MATAAATFIPEVVAAGIEKALKPAWVLVDGCNRSYEGAIKNQGDTVKIRTVGSVTAHSLARSASRSSIEAAEEIEGSFLTLPIDQILYTNAKVDSIDELTTDVSLMNATTKEMADALADGHDTYVAGLIYSAYTDDSTIGVLNSGSNWALTSSNILDMVLKAKELLFTNNVKRNAALELIINPAIEALLTKTGVLQMTSNNDIYENGKIGKVLGVDVKVSNNLYTDDSSVVYCCLRVKDKAMAFAQQVSKVIHYRDDSNELDADFIKSYSLFGAKVLFTDEIAVLPVASVTL